MNRLSYYRSISVTGLFARRLLLCSFLVFATYNETGQSYYDWLIGDLTKPTSIVVLVGIALLCAWVAIVRAAFLALRIRGIVAMVGLFVALELLRIGLGLRTTHAMFIDVIAVQIIVAVVLAAGLTLAPAQVRFSGERDVLHFPP